jgi:hypothetical protein
MFTGRSGCVLVLACVSSLVALAAGVDRSTGGTSQQNALPEERFAKQVLSLLQQKKVDEQAARMKKLTLPDSVEQEFQERVSSDRQGQREPVRKFRTKSGSKME